jgi:gamma-glutamylputrescine oxidase
LMAGCSGHGMGLSFNCARVMVENSFGALLPKHLDIKRFLN